MIQNAPTFLDESNDPDQIAFDLEWISGFSKPVLFTLGDQSPPTFAPVVMRLSGALPDAEVLTLPGAGHVPHATHPDAYVEAIIEFTHKHSATKTS
jgi:pimeloyl-ACP methyl ester carboxylesterase